MLLMVYKEQAWHRYGEKKVKIHLSLWTTMLILLHLFIYFFLVGSRILALPYGKTTNNMAGAVSREAG